MVYTTLDLILGFVMTKEELIELLDLTPKPSSNDTDGEELFVDEDGNTYSDIHFDVLFTETFGHKLQLYKFVCCSESAYKLFIIGFQMHRYYRKPIKCEKCFDKCWLCDKCIGHTNNGFYDVDAISNRPVEANIRHICPWCFHDNKKDLGGPKETASVVDSRFVTGKFDYQHWMQCDVCNGRQDEYRCPQEFMEWHNQGYYNSLNSFQTGNHLSKPIKFYYMVNDCLSCS